MKKLLSTFALTLLASGLALAQTAAPPENPQAAEPPPPVAAAPADAPQPPDPPQVYTSGGGVTVTRQPDGAVMIRRDRGMFMGGQEMGMEGPAPGKWWLNPEMAKRLGLTDDQVTKIKKIFLDHRLQLIDLHANLEKQEVLLQPMVNADHPDENAVLAQIDKVAEARANLEKSDARMLFAIRDTLTPEQWQKLREMHAMMRHRHRVGQRMGRRMERGGMMRGGPGGGVNSGGPQTAPAPPSPPDSQESGSQQP
jgi:periplasmic protein CpxP/Spy